MRNKMKRFLGILLSLALVLSLFPSESLTAYADNTGTLLTTITATGKEQANYSKANVATVSFSYTAGGSSAYFANWGWWGYGWSATVSAAEGYNITKCIFYDDANSNATDSEAPFVVETTEEDKTPKVNGAPIVANTSKGIKKIEVYGYATPAHTHSFNYSATGATITATCSAEGCTLPEVEGKHIATLTIAAPLHKTYGDGKDATAVITDTYSIQGEAKVQYQKKSGGSYGTATETAPTDAGDYKASITVGGATASMEYAIAPMALTIDAATATDRTYDKDSTAVTISAVTFKDSSSNPVALTLTTDYTVTGAMTDANAGNNKEVTATVMLSNGNYSLVTNTATTTVNIGKAGAQTIADVTDTLLYTATSVSESLAGKMPSDAGTLSYSAGTASKTGSVTVSGFAVNATSGAVTATLSGGAVGDTVTLPVTISSTNYADSTVNVKITLTAKGIQTITADDVTVTYGDTDKKVSASVTDPTEGGGAISYAVKEGSGDYIEVDATTGALTIKKVPADGKAYVTVTAAGTAAYEQATKDVTVTINKANSTVTKAPEAKMLTYNGQAQALVTAGEATGGEMQYALGTATEATEPYTTSIPAKTEAGIYYVWYRVKGDLNHYDSEPRCVTVNITNAPPAPTAAPTAAPTHVPKTGDGANLVLWIGLILLGFLGIIAFAGMAGRKHRNR